MIHIFRLLETVKVRRSGFCYRLPYLQFLERYKMLCLDTWPNFSGPVVEGVNYILRDLPIPNGEFAFGQNKIFVRSPRSVSKLLESNSCNRRLFSNSGFYASEQPSLRISLGNHFNGKSGEPCFSVYNIADFLLYFLFF